MVSREISKFRVLQVLDAISAIEEKGIAGIGEAAMCAGDMIAMVVLITHLREKFKKQGPLAVTKHDEQVRLAESIFKVIEVGRVTDFTTRAKVDMTGSRAIVMGKNGSIFLLKHDEPGVLTDASGMNLAMLFDECYVVEAVAGPPPYDDLFRFLRYNHVQKMAWDLLGITFDSESSEELKQSAVEDLNELFADGEFGSTLEKYIVDCGFDPVRIRMMNFSGVPRVGRFGELVDKAVGPVAK